MGDFNRRTTLLLTEKQYQFIRALAYELECSQNEVVRSLIDANIERREEGTDEQEN